jgi:integrase
MTKLADSISELSAKSINSYLRARQESVSSITVANERRMLLTLWRWAWEEGHVDEAPRGVLRVRTTLKPVEAWTVSQCSALVKGAEKFSGYRLRNGADLGTFLEAWVVLAYETGARYGDIFAWKGDNFRNGAVGWVTSKTGVVCTRVLSDKAMSLVREMLKKSPDGRVLGWVCCRRQSFKLMRRLLADCVQSGSGRWLRRSAATHLEAVDPGKAQWFLAHKTAGLAARHYLDQSQLSGRSCRPPAIW